MRLVIGRLWPGRRVSQQAAAALPHPASTTHPSRTSSALLRTSSPTRIRSSGMLPAANGAAGGMVDLEPLCITPAFKAAEAALLSKLASGAAGCHADYSSLESLGEGHSFADALANRDLNRYTDVLPYDHTRVRLRDLPPGGRDYINASLLASPPRALGGVPWTYVAAQGPLEHTREAFWQCVFEQRCSAVVMLTNCVERNVRKCARYIPSQPSTKKAFGRFTVKKVDEEEIGADLCRRSLVVARSTGGGEKHPLDHYHYAAWPDHGVPASPDTLLHICERLVQSGAHRRPILVHCSAGIGRSGVFCVLDIVTRRLRQVHLGDARGGAQAVDLLALVGQMREQRMGMVQTREQYVFCHTALLRFVRQLDAQQQAPPPAAVANCGTSGAD